MEHLAYNIGFVKIPRSILSWEWYGHPDVSRVYFHIMFKANYAPARWRGIEILIDEHITSINKLSIELEMSEFKVRESLNKLKSTGYLEIYTTNKFTKLKLMKSRLASSEDDFSNKQIQNEIITKPLSNQKQTTTNNKNKEIKERKEKFKNEILKFSNEFSNHHLNTFFSYWSAENEQTGRQKFEEEKFWSLEQKLKSWIVFDKNAGKKKFTKNRP